MAVLCYLARHSDRVVSSDELLDQVWQGRVVTHASVQKSINALRNALAELAGDGEFVAHYSKRGYQLVVPVRFEPEVASIAEGAVAAENRLQATQVEAGDSRGRRLRTIWLTLPIVMVLMSLVGALVWVLVGQDFDLPPAALTKHHTTIFTSAAPLSALGQRERRMELHPDGKRAAYIRDLGTNGVHQSQIMIRDPSGSDWLLASSEGTWADLAWSPSGRNLVATEIRRAEGLPRTPDYFEKPNSLYSFHIFTLDFRGERLLEKNLLSQWQGVVASVTWWDENTLEFVASLGPGSANERYRYRIAEQKLSTLNPRNAGFIPLQSVVHDKRTALISRRHSRAQLEFLDANQDAIATIPLPTSALDISWIPDGTGLLVLDKSGPTMYTLDLYGEMSLLQLPQWRDGSFSYPRYRKDGEAIVLTTSQLQTSLNLRQAAGSPELIAEGGAQRLARFLPADGSVIFLLESGGEYTLWRWQRGRKELLQVMEKPVESLIVAADNHSLVYHSGEAIWQLPLGEPLPTQQSQAIWRKAGVVELLYYAPATEEILFVRRSGETRNIWWRNLRRGEERQITFGSVGTALATAERLYFQYRDQPGLWQLEWAQPNPVQISTRLPKNSKLLHLADSTAFFVSGGPCRESNLQALDLQADTLSPVVDQVLGVTSHDFHPTFGLLQMECRPANSQIIQFVSAADK